MSLRQTTTAPPLLAGFIIIFFLFIIDIVKCSFQNVLKIPWLRDEMWFQLSMSLFNQFYERFALIMIRCPFAMFQVNFEKLVLHCGFNIALNILLCL